MFKRQQPFSKKTKDLPDTPSPDYTAAQIKNYIQTPSDENKAFVDGFLDEIEAPTGAGNIGAKKADGTDSNVQAAIDEKATNTRVQNAENRLNTSETNISVLQQTTSDLETNVEDNTNRVNNIVASTGESNTEIVDARYDSVNDKTFNYLGERLDETTSQLAQIATNVKNFGAKGDGVTDDSTSIQDAIDSVTYGGVVFFPEGDYKCSNIQIKKPITIMGVGLGSKLIANATGYVFDITKGTILNHESGNRLMGVNVNNLYFVGDDRSIDAGAIKMSYVDNCFIEHIMIEYFQREALNLYGSVRESSFFDIKSRYCGTMEKSYPTLNLNENTSEDAHNNNKFTDCNWIYSLGNTVEIDTSNANARGKTRHIIFSNNMFHGIVSNADGGVYTFTDSQKRFSHAILKDCHNINFVNSTRFHVGGLETPTIHLLAGVNGIPENVNIDSSVSITDHYAYVADLSHGIKVDDGSLNIANTLLKGNSPSIETATGTVIDIGSGMDIEGGSVITNGTSKTDFHSETIDFNNATLREILKAEITAISNNGGELSIESDQAGNAIIFKSTNASGVMANRAFITGETGTPMFDFNLDLNLRNGKKIMTGNSITASTAYSIVAKHPIYDDSGTLIGFLPIYGTID